MSEAEIPELGSARFAAILGAYGADPARWPLKEREAAERATSGTDRAALAAARRLDLALDAADAPLVSSALRKRLLADFDRRARRASLRGLLESVADAVWPGAPLWQPACAFATALTIGLGIAAFAPFDIPQQDDGTSSVFALDGTPDVDAGQGI